LKRIGLYSRDAVNVLVSAMSLHC